MSKGVKIVLVIVLLVLAGVIAKWRYDSIPKFGSSAPGSRSPMAGAPVSTPAK